MAERPSKRAKTRAAAAAAEDTGAATAPTSKRAETRTTAAAAAAVEDAGPATAPTSKRVKTQSAVEDTGASPLLMILSPAKTLDESPCVAAKAAAGGPGAPPRLHEMAHEIAAHLKGMSVPTLTEALKVKPALAQTCKEQYNQLSGGTAELHHAVTLFNGFAFTEKGLNPRRLSVDDLVFANSTLRILSGQYGVLRPLDAIAPYRLEMGTNLAPPSISPNKLSKFWRGAVTQVLQEDFGTAEGERVLVNVASDEYSAAVDLKQLEAAGVRVITCKFDVSGGTVFKKYARGALARFVITNRVTTVEGIKQFTFQGKAKEATFQEAKSDDTTLVFS